jgi:Mrp family chromosome partitioning ATPase
VSVAKREPAVGPAPRPEGRLRADEPDPAPLGSVPSTALAIGSSVPLFEAAAGGLPPGMATDAQFEVFRELRTRLLLTAAELKRPRFTTLVVPVAAGAGASFVARNLAATFTLKENAISVLIDCDFKDPNQHKVLDASFDDEGLSDHLDYWSQSTTDLNARIKSFLRPTTVPRLYLIPAGRCEAVKAGRPREYFSSAAMHAMMRRLTREPCFVFIDGPPVAGSPDARILSDHADFVILLVGYGQTSPAAIAHWAATFRKDKLVGVVFNGAG